MHRLLPSRSLLRGSAAVCLMLLGAAGLAAEPQTPPLKDPPPDLFADQPKGLSTRTVATKLVYVGEVFGNPVGGERQGAIYEGYVKLGLGVNLERAVGWQGASFYANILAPHGPSLTQNYVHDLNVLSNIDGYDSVRLYKFWLQQDVGKWSLRLGVMAADKEFFGTESAVLFMNNAFGTPPIFSQSVAAPIFPLSAPGIRLRWNPTPAFSLRTAVFSGDVGGAAQNSHELKPRLAAHDGVLVLVEASYKTGQGGQGAGLPGTIRLGGYYDSKFFPTERDGREVHGTGGGYLCFDQQLYREPGSGGAERGLSGYIRGGAAPSDRSLVDYELETGLSYAGPLRARPGDSASLGFAWTHLSPQLPAPPPPDPPTHHEAILEATYLAVLSSWCSLQPDAQWIFNPGGTKRRADALALGLRMSLAF